MNFLFLNKLHNITLYRTVGQDLVDGGQYINVGFAQPARSGLFLSLVLLRDKFI